LIDCLLQAFVNTGINLPLQFESNAWSCRREDRLPTSEFVDFDREPGKVSSSSLYMVDSLLKKNLSQEIAVSSSWFSGAAEQREVSPLPTCKS